MNNERNSLKAGIFIIIAILLAIGVVIGIKGVGRFLEPMQYANVAFKLSDDVGGIAPGDEVRIGGAKVGVVRSVELNDPNSGQPGTSINFTIPRRFTLHQDAVVSIQSTVTGVSVLNFSNLGSGPVLQEGQSLQGKASSLTALFESAPDIAAMIHDIRNVTLPKIDNAVDKTTDTIAIYKQTGAAATDFIGHVNGKIDPIVERYNGVTDTAKTALQNISDLFGDTKVDFRTTIANVREATTIIKDRLPEWSDKVDGMLTSINDAVKGANVALEDVKKIAANTRDATAAARSALITNRGKIDAMIADLKETGDNLKNASAEIRRSPWRLLYHPGPGEMANLNLYDSARQFADGAGQLNDAATSLRDALKDPDTKQSDIDKLVEKLDDTFANFNEIEKQLWQQVKQ
jgi:ABC-type transporter Mla subunit MlaD